MINLLGTLNLIISMNFSNRQPRDVFFEHLEKEFEGTIIVIDECAIDCVLNKLSELDLCDVKRILENN